MRQYLTQTSSFSFRVSHSGLVAIIIRARCKSGNQMESGMDENLRVEINGLRFRELPPEKYAQLFNIPPAYNGSQLKGAKQTLILFTVLEQGEHILNLVPQHSAFIEDIEIRELYGQQYINLELKEQAEDGDRKPWHTFVFIDLPIKYFSAEITIQRRLRDSDDVKVIVDGETKKSSAPSKFSFWYLIGALLPWIVKKSLGRSEKTKIEFDEQLDNGIHFIELRADRMPILHRIEFLIGYYETEAAARAAKLIQSYRQLIKYAAKEFGVDPIVVGGVIYQEQATNVNFIDTLTDHIGGLLHLNTSIGIGQVRVNTARDLEKLYPELYPGKDSPPAINDTFIRVERLKDPYTNIRYVTAKLHFSDIRWKNKGFDISDKPEILGTLYNIEDVNDPIKPHANPQTNGFGAEVKENYEKVRHLLR